MTPQEVTARGGLRSEEMPVDPSQVKVGTSGECQGDEGSREPEWVLPEPTEPQEPPGGGPQEGTISQGRIYEGRGGQINRNPFPWNKG